MGFNSVTIYKMKIIGLKCHNMSLKALGLLMTSASYYNYWGQALQLPCTSVTCSALCSHKVCIKCALSVHLVCTVCIKCAFGVQLEYMLCAACVQYD